MKFFDEPGIARKLCQCGKFVPARSSYCGNCKFEYLPGALEKIMTKKDIDPDKGGKGRKQCPKCLHYTGCRSKVCGTEGCGNDFTLQPSIKATKEKPKGEAEKESVNLAKAIGFKGNVVLIPSGGCQYIPQGNSKEEVADWCNLVVMNGLANGELYGVKALKYFLRETADVNNEDYPAFCEYVDNWYYKILDRI